MSQRKFVKELFHVHPTDQSAVVYTNGKNEVRQTYCTFLKISKQIIALWEIAQEKFQAFGTIGTSPYCIAVDITPDVNLPVCMYAMIQLSVVFLPVDMATTRSNLVNVFRKADIKLLVVHKDNLKSFSDYIYDEFQIQVEIITQNFTSMHTLCYVDLPDCNPLFETTLDHVYMIQTSGTTGESKLVVVPHKCIMPNIEDLRKIFALEKTDVLFISSAFTFDASLIQMMIAWSSNACVLLTCKVLLNKPNVISTVLSNYAVTIIQCTPSFLSLIGQANLKRWLFHDKTSLNVLAIGGEKFVSKQKLFDLQPEKYNIRVYNIYGVTELSAWASIQLIECDKLTKDLCLAVNDEYCCDWVSIGNGLSDIQIWLKYFDENQKYGEIMLGSKSRRCLVENSEDNHSIHTGDIGLLRNHQIYCCGRRNSLIKRNGQFVYIDRLEVTVSTLHLIETCCVVHRPTQSSNSFMLFVKIKKSYKKDDIKAEILTHIKKQLSVVYIPDCITFVEFMPLTSHGKIDKNKLVNKAFIPHDAKDLQRLVHNTWRFTLNKVPCKNDNFTQCGGDSFLAALFTNEIINLSPVHISHEILFHKVLSTTFDDIMSYITICSSKRTDYQIEEPTINDETLLPWLYDPIYPSVNVLRRQHPFHSYVLPGNLMKSVHGISLSQKWERNLKKCIDASPLIVLNEQNNGVLYIGSHSHLFSAISLKDGCTIWQRLLPDRIESSAAITNDGELVCVGCYDGCLYILHTENGQTYWTFKTNNPIKSSPATVSYIRPLYTNIVIVGSHDRYLYALNVSAKNCLWKLYGGASCFSSPLIYNHHVYTAFLNGNVCSIDISTGKLSWQVNISKPVFSSIFRSRSFLLFGCVDGCLYALNHEDGKQEWCFQTQGAIFSSPVAFLVDNKEYIVCGSNDSFLYCINNNGDCIWKFKGDGPFYSTPALYQQTQPDGDVYVVAITTKGTLYVVEALSGATSTCYRFKGEIFSSPVVVDDIIAVGCRDNHVYCLQFT